MARTAEDVVRRYIEEMRNHRRLELVDELVDPDYRADGRFVGRDFVRRNIDRLHTAFPDLSIEVLNLVADGYRVATLFALNGNRQAVFAGIDATGRRVRFLEAGFFHVRNGMVVAADWVADGLGARIQLGVLPEDFLANPRR